MLLQTEGKNVKTPSAKRQLSLFIDRELYEKLYSKSYKEGTTVSHTVRSLVKKFVQRKTK